MAADKISPLAGEADEICMGIASLTVYDKLVEARRNLHKDADSAEAFPVLFRKVCELVKSALFVKGMQIREKYVNHPYGGGWAKLELDEFIMYLHIAAEKYLPVWWETKVFFDERGLNRRQQTERPQMHVH